ncbi:MAG: hypothetical protein QF824_02370 [Candidatus Woesearchaeota archaeon]|jgi:hypothetical protein|nr:hypothetical protein [Candidatus Woesearchaeota archaeon]
MKKIIGLLLVLSTVLLSGFAPLSKVFISEPIQIGQENELFVLVNNDLNEDFDRTRARIFIHDLGVTLYSQGFDLQAQDNQVARFYWTPDESVKPGDYIARVEVSNSQFKDWEYVYLNIR